ncbi:hypothetical protein V6N00_08880 [Tersicoccus sp. MR15.9]|uniref:hypothetical protein n=1 Tax=Tersicoccus mangrovi TaxID=3121635 RepID=UPI002FE5A64D
MPWWSWILLWGGLVLASAVVLALACRRVVRAGLALVREVDRAATVLSLPDPPVATADEANDVPSGARDLT